MKTEPGWNPIPGETPIDDVSGLLLPEIGTRRQLNQVEIRAEYIAAIQAADHLDYAPLVELHKRYASG